MIPPMTTVASGRCTSAPAPVAIAIGTKPSEATSAVISTGRSRVRRLRRPRRSAAWPSLRSRSMKVMMTRPLSTATPDSAMKPTAGADRERDAAQQQRRTPPVSASGTPLNTSSASAHRAEADEEQQEDQEQRERHDDRQPLRRRDQLLELAAPADPVAGRQFHLLP